MTTTAPASGLEGVVASSTAISSIEDGVLRYRGYRIEDLARYAGFEEVIDLLWDGELPNTQELEAIKGELAAAYRLPELTERFLGRIPPTGAGSDPMAFLLAAITLISLGEPEADDRSSEASRRKDEFLAMLAHELRNPLAPIRMGLELIRVAGDAPGAVERVRSTMELQVAHMVRLIDDLLDVSRITSGKIQLQRGPALLGTLLDSAIDATAAAIADAHIQLKVQVPDAWPNTFRQSWFIPAIEYVQADRFRRQCMQMMADIMDRVDVILAPSFAANLLLITNNTGNPSLTLRTGFKDDGTPHGITLIGRLFDEGTLCVLGRAIEREIEVWQEQPLMGANPGVRGSTTS